MVYIKRWQGAAPPGFLRTMQPSKVVAPDRIAACCLSAAVALAPLPFGSVEPTAVAVWCIMLGICLVFAPVRSLRVGQLALAGLAGFVVVGYALVLHEQLAEHPWLATPDPIWRQAQAALATPLLPSVSIARNQAWFGLGRPLVCVLAIACGFLVGTDPGRARRLIKVVAWSGAAYAAYGIVIHLFDPTHILGRDKRAYLESVTGTFVNRNTAGAYFGSCAVVWSLLLWERVRREIGGRLPAWRVVVAQLFSAPSKKAVVAFVMFFLCLVAMFMTRSRAAVAISLLALVIAFTAYFRRDLPRRTGLLTALAGGSVLAIMLFEVMGAGVGARFELQGLNGGGRFEVYRSTLRMIADHPWFGTGAGTFAQAFPAYRSAAVSMSGTWDMAHNTLLEIAAEMGVPIATVVVVTWITIFAVLVRGVVIRRRDLIVPVAGLAVATLAVFHSLIDFSLQIPGYAIVAMALIGTGLAQSFPRKQGEAAESATGVGSMRVSDPFLQFSVNPQEGASGEETRSRRGTD
jgi:O-antigen ligase